MHSITNTFIINVRANKILTHIRNTYTYSIIEAPVSVEICQRDHIRNRNINLKLVKKTKTNDLRKTIAKETKKKKFTAQMNEEIRIHIHQFFFDLCS